MDLFTVDNVGETELLDLNINEKNSVKFVRKVDALNEVDNKNVEEDRAEEDEEDEDLSDADFGDLPRNIVDISQIIKLPKTAQKTELQENMDKFCVLLERIMRARENGEQISDDEDETTSRRKDAEKNLECVTTGIEKKKSVEMLTEKQRIKRGKAERSKTKGKNWFNLPATEVTDEIKNDLEVIQMRSVLDPQHFYKKNDLKVLPKFFQVGKVLPSPLDYYNERDSRKSKRKTLVDELMDDAAFQRFNKRKYAEVMEEKKKSGYHKANKKMKKLKKNKS
ncbi:deoxynucleotidyltransferase terminal-interacting protein 2 isoform X2 [Bradysia coprophila]|nr:deoxynucleotidyltransferase terminal-interacting protein 2 isoform X2 [Bradysia coprophila]